VLKSIQQARILTIDERSATYSRSYIVCDKNVEAVQFENMGVCRYGDSKVLESASRHWQE